MGDVVVQVEGLGKLYQIAHRRPGGSLREAMTQGARGLAQGLRRWVAGRARRTEQEAFWALRDVSFQLRRGEVLGVIGRNGAGKSTLLKLLSRITEPTTGWLGLRGRLASLLEVGTGFHPELTGRENIYLNGSILGMSRAEIRKKFDEIVEFAGVEQFLDTPVKRYSSGMGTRLAFSVAAHLEPEILIVDEVLAVGDIAFQKKCMGKMESVAKQHRTILFVSHNMSAVRALCTRGILLDRGRMVMDGGSREVADAYVNANTGLSNIAEVGLEDRTARTTGAVRFSDLRFEDEAGVARSTFEEGETIRIVLSYRAYRAVPDLGLVLHLRWDATREAVTSFRAVLARKEVKPGDEATVVLTLPSVPLRPGDYSLYICLGNQIGDRFYDVIDDNLGLPRLTITAADEDPHTKAGYFSIPWRLSVEPARAPS